MAGVDDLVTVQKNGVVAVNSLVQALAEFKQIYSSFVGTLTSNGINANTLVTTGSGRIVNVSIITAAGSGAGTIHDVASVVDTSADNAIFAIPNTTGVVAVNFPFKFGIVVKPASGCNLSISYSED